MRVRRVVRWMLAVLFLVVQLSTSGLAVPGSWRPTDLQQVAYALGLLMVLIQGVRYIVADSAQERSDVKKGLIYVVIGVMVVYGFCKLLLMYCGLASISCAPYC